MVLLSNRRGAVLMSVAVVVGGLTGAGARVDVAAAATYPNIHVLDEGPVYGPSLQTTLDGLWTVYEGGVAGELRSVPTSGGRVRTLHPTRVTFVLSPDGGRVVYWDSTGMWSQPVAGGPETSLADLTGITIDQVTVTADGASVLFRSDRGTPGTFNLDRVGIEGGGVTRLNPVLVPGGDVAFFHVSHDGASVAYVADQERAGIGELYVAPTAGGSAVKRSAPIDGSGGVTDVFEWAPDDSWLVYLANATVSSRFDAYGVRRDDGAVTRLSEDPTGASTQDWSFAPDSSFVVLRLGKLAGTTRLVRTDRNATDRVVLTVAGPAEIINPEMMVSLGGGRVVFNFFDGAAVRWGSVGLDGTDRRTLSSQTAGGRLSADGRSLIYSENGGVTYGAWVRPVDGSGPPVRVADPVLLIDQPADDGTSVVVRLPSGEPVTARLDGSATTLVFGPLPVFGATSAVVVTSDARHVVAAQDRYTDGQDALLSAGPTFSADDTTAFTSLPPARILDTRLDAQVGYSGPKPTEGEVVRLKVRGRAGIPDLDDVRAVVLNVTATDASGPGYVTVWPAGQPRPLASSLNLERAGQTRPNLVTVALGVGGSVDLFTQSGTNLVADVAGYYTAAGSAAAGRFFPLAPARVLDTRDDATRPTAGETVRLPLAGRAGLPGSGLSAVVLNVTATDAAAAGYVTVWPSGQPRPLASNLNLERSGQTVPNQVIVPVGPDGAVQLFTQTGTHLVADVAGWFTDGTEDFGTSGLFRGFAPVRMLDTRAESRQRWAGGEPEAGAVVPVSFATPGEGVIALTVNVTVTAARGPGFVTAWPAGAPRPLASNLNTDAAGQTIPNHVTVRAGRPTEEFRLYTQSGGHLIADITGTYLA